VLPTDLDVDRDPVLLRLDFHRESVVLHDYATSNTSTRLVSALDVAHKLAQELDMSTGILAPDTLWYTKTATGSRVAVWCPARVWNVKIRPKYGEGLVSLKLPMPGLVFICLPGSQAPYVFAAKARPRETTDQLYHCPAFNVFQNGRVCTGTHNFPSDPAQVPGDFFRSNFSLAGDSEKRSQRYPDVLLDLWHDLHKQSTYPLDDLVPALQVLDAMAVGA
jgi:PRTRC genetic system protein B